MDFSNLEPKNGDFTSYLDKLTRSGNTGSNTVGNNAPAAPAPVTMPTPSPQSTSSPLSNAPWGKTDSEMTSLPPVKTSQPNETMAKRANRKNAGIIAGVLGLILAYAAFQQSSLLPMAICGVLALNLLKTFFKFTFGSSANTPLTPQAPLSSSYRKDAKDDA